MASVKVAVRVRPLNKRELDMCSTVIVKVDGNVTQLCNNKLAEPPYDVFNSRDKIKQFTFDHSYWSVDSSHPNFAPQDRMFSDLGTGVVESSFSGYNACIFAYGQTGSGKTHTMMGSENNPGLTPRICESMFENMDKPDLTYRTEVSYLEIYNEHVRDLLREGQHSNLKVREHPKDGPYVQDLSRRVVTSYREIADLLCRGNLNRTTASTGMNEHSSRSHAIFTIYFSQARISGDLPSEINSKVHLVDLAGSERADTAGTVGERLKEGGSINKSLVTLGSVISALADVCESSSSSSSSTQRKFIPYRNSVLTWLLKDSLGGNSRTVMVATISPAECCYSETLSTLRYAKRAKKIVNRPSVNEDTNVRLIRELRAENAKLKRMLADAMMQEGLTPLNEVAETREKLSKNEEKMQELMEAWTDKWKEVISVLKEHAMLALRKEGSGVLLDSGLPYLLCIDDSVLSTGMKLYHIKEGDTLLGRDNPIHKPDIALSGRFIENVHCIVRFEDGHCYLVPGEGAMCCIDSIQVVEPTKLTQGSMIQLGRNHFFRFNDPAEAAKLREEMNEGYDRGNMSHVWKDIQRAWSTFSMTDSAIDSEVSMLKTDARCKEWLDLDRQEMKKRDKEDTKSNEEEEGDAKVVGDEIKNFLADAQEKIKLLNLEIDKQLVKAEKSDSEDGGRDAASKRMLNAEYELLRMEKERQEEEWCELEKQKQHQLSLRMEDQLFLNKKQEQLEKMREAEKMIWSGEIEEMRAMIDEEIHQLCEGPPSRLSRTSCASSHFTLNNLSFDLHLPLSSCGHRRRSLEQVSCHRHCNGRDTFECVSLDRYQTKHNKISTPRHSTISDATYEELLPSDIEAFKLTLPSYDRYDSFSGSSIKLPVDLHEDSFSSLSLSFEEDLQGTVAGVNGMISNAYKTVRAIFLDQFGWRPARWMKLPMKHLQVARQLNEKLLNINKFISRVDKLLPGNNNIEEVVRVNEGKMKLTKNLLSLYESLSSMNNQQNNFLFSQAAQTLVEINKLAKTCKSFMNDEADEDDEMKALVQTEVCLRREMFLYVINEEWDQMFDWNSHKKAARSSNEVNEKVSVDMKLAVNNRKKMKSICEAMQISSTFDDKLRSFGKSFTVELMRPGIMGGFLSHADDKPCCIEVVNKSCHSPSSYSSPTTLTPPDEQTSSPSPPSPSSSPVLYPTQPVERIIERIEQSLRLLWCAFSFSLETNPSFNLISRIGEFICDEIFQLLCQHCLVPYLSQLDFDLITKQHQRYHIPECPAWKHFNETLSLASNFHKQITQLGFLPSSSFLLQLTPSIRKCVSHRHKQYMDIASDIGISTLGVAVKVSSSHSIGLVSNEDDEEKVHKNVEEGLGGDFEEKREECEDGEWSVHEFMQGCIHSIGGLKIPPCSVSLPSCDVVKLMYSILRDAQSCCPQVALFLQSSVENVAQHFINVISNHQHSMNLTFEALIHNSCLFVAQHLTVVDKLFSQHLSTLPEQLVEQKEENERNFKKMKERLKDFAQKEFSDVVNNEKKIISEFMSDVTCFACVADDDGVKLRNSIDKILDTIQQVSSSWSPVLSSCLYCRSIGVLLDEMVREVVASLLTVVEFSEEDCVVLRDILYNIISTAPNLFNISSVSSSTNTQLLIHEHVPSWMQLTELHRLLDSNLRDIRDRWSSGLGPLSLHFTAKQVASLVLAIFENTSKREAVIQEILSNPSVHILP